MVIEPERLAYWYLRLNGFLTTVNFLVHPETRRDYSTEVDVLGVRFPFRAENLRRPMKDDAFLVSDPTRVLLVIAEVESGQCALNGPWTNPKARNMEKILAAIGAFPRSQWAGIARSLYKSGWFRDDGRSLSLVCIGAYPSQSLGATFDQVPQITFERILRFIHARLLSYLDAKAQHDQWDRDGKALWNAVDQHRQVDHFLRAIRVEPRARSRGP